MIRIVFPCRFLAVVALAAAFPVFADDPAGAEQGDDKRQEFHLYMKGRYVYQRNCVDCHGATGRGNGPWAEGLAVKPRNFRSGIFKFRTTAYGTLPVDGDLRRTIRSGISGTTMPIFANLQDEEVDALVVYLKSLSRAWKDPELASQPVPQPAVPEWFASDEERVRRSVAGGQRFAALCAGCHGAEGKGDGVAGKGLVDGWGNEIAPAVLAAPHHKSGDAPSDLYRSISTGLNGTPMVGYAETLKPEEIWE
ncbi:MAG TPA: cytochrome c, partial [Bacteroidia bacterium]|nr:cytochrome c [Bacteroidia bacterium]